MTKRKKEFQTELSEMKTKWFLPAFKWFQLFGSAFG